MNLRRVRRLAAAPVALTAAALAALGLVTALLFAPLAALDGKTTSPQVAAGSTSCMDRVLATIRTIESSGRYDLRPNGGGASGAYQFIDSTWRATGATAGIDVGIYPQAWTAPADVQDTVARFAVARFLAAGNTVQDIPVEWYYPAALSTPALLDIVPVPEAGNVLTPRQYQARWVTELARQGGCQAAPAVSNPADLNVPELPSFPNGEIPEVALVEVQPGRRLAPAAAVSWWAMAAAATRDGITLTITSAYRSASYQAELIQRVGLLGQGGLAMEAGRSPHGLGIAADIDVLPAGVFDWLQANAARFCWRNAAPAIERWHWQDTEIATGCTPASS